MNEFEKMKEKAREHLSILNGANVDKLKEEISYHTACKPCRGCGECERILDIAIKEKQELGKDAKPCSTCRV